MRTTVVIGDDLPESPRRAATERTKREFVEPDSAALIRSKSQEKIRGLRGKLRWTGDLDEVRRNG